MIKHIRRWHENRFRFLDTLPKNGIVAEIGVSHGFHAWGILTVCCPNKMYLIDPWFHQGKKVNAKIEQERFEQKYNLVKSKFCNNSNVYILREYSDQAVKQFDDEYFDWVYIDGNHFYDYVRNDLNIWWEKVKVGGILCGHDYCIRGKPQVIQVKPAVDEFVFQKGLKLDIFDKDFSFPTWKIEKCGSGTTSRM